MHSFVGESPQLRAIIEQANRFAVAKDPVLLVGASGTGKSELAEYIHKRSNCSGKEYVHVNCATIRGPLARSHLFGHLKGAFTGADSPRRGLIALADGGTLFLDEVQDLDMEVQAQLLIVLQKGTYRQEGSDDQRYVKFRLICATNVDLEQRVAEDKFRMDLLNRIRVFKITIPPLQERPADIIPIAKAFLQSTWPESGVRGFTPDAQAYLEQQPWPGNAHDLRNTLANAVLNCNGRQQIAISDLGVGVVPSTITSIPRLPPLPEIVPTPSSQPGPRIDWPRLAEVVQSAPFVETLGTEGVTSTDLWRLSVVEPLKPALGMRFNELVRELYRHGESRLASLALPPQRLARLFGLCAASATHNKSQSQVELFEKLAERFRSRLSVEALVEEMADLQGMRLSASAAERLRARQREVLLAAFARAWTLGDLWSSPLDKVAAAAPALPSGPAELRGFVAHILTVIHDLRAELHRGASDTEATISRAVQRLESAGPHAPGPPDAPLGDALFAAYVLGMAYFEAMTHVGTTLVEGLLERHLVKAATNVSLSFAEGLRGVFVLGERILFHVDTRFYGRRRAQTWEAILGSFLRSSKEFKDALRAAASMRHVPPGHPELVTLPQLAHWDGWGGLGEFLESLRRLPEARDDALLSTLADHVHFAFNWHGLQAAGHPGLAHFGGRRQHFTDAAEALGEYSAACTAALLFHEALNDDAPRAERLIRVWADATGPARRAEQRLMRAIHVHDAEARFELVATEVAGFAAHTLATMPSEKRVTGEVVTTLLFRDLNLPFPGEPGGPTPDDSITELLAPNSYDVYSAAVALHQIADSTKKPAPIGLDRVRAVLAFATRLLRPFGVITIPDVGAGRCLEPYLLPSNLWDNEGSWGASTFFDGSQNCFADVACALSTGEFLATTTDGTTTDARYKIPLPLLSLSWGTPELLQTHGFAIYEFTPFLVVDLRLEEIQRLDERFRRAHAAGMGIDARVQAIADALLTGRGIPYAALVARVERALSRVRNAMDE